MTSLLGTSEVGPLPDGKRLRDRLNAELAIRNPVPVGLRASEGSALIRFIASSAWVQVHVQGDIAGGGGFEYTPGTYVSSTEYDCRVQRQQDADLGSLSDGNYIVYLVPVDYDLNGTKILYDGQGDNPDYMSFSDIFAISGLFVSDERWSILHLGRPSVPALPDGSLDEGDVASFVGLFAGIDY